MEHEYLLPFGTFNLSRVEFNVCHGSNLPLTTYSLGFGLGSSRIIQVDASWISRVFSDFEKTQIEKGSYQIELVGFSLISYYTLTI